MSYREDARPVVVPSLFIYRSGAFTRWFVFTLAVVTSVIFAAFAVRVAPETQLACTRSAEGHVTCQFDRVLPLGIPLRGAAHEVRSARMEWRQSEPHDSSAGSYAIVLELVGGGTDEYDGVRALGMTGDEVVGEVNALLAASAPRSARWTIRDSDVGMSVLLALVAMLGLAIGTPSFWHTRVTLDPRRQILVRLQRWPLGSDEHAMPLDECAGVESVEKQIGRNRVFTVRLISERPDASRVDLEIAYSSEGNAKRLAERLAAEIARWKDKS